ncbi:VIT family domain-containing protein [Rutstroemia sp. NJR-2017a WRK4]|nr:VIT family domain-containing protein [Rutstroemia sp. NJR-2017a WRK4]
MAAYNDNKNLLDYVTRSLTEEEEFHFLRFEFLQRLNIVHMQTDLARKKSKFQKERKATADDMHDLKITMRDYATAIRDYQYLKTKHSLKKVEMRKRKLLLQRYFQTPGDFNDPFQSHYSYFEDAHEKIDPLRTIFMRYLPARLTYSHKERGERSKEYSEGKAPKEVYVFVDRLVRFIVASVGGIFLVVPMIIMSLGPSQTKSLVTVSVSVTIFALMLSFGIRISNAEALVSTATYAAVLVVFVGTSTPTSATTTANLPGS